MRRIHCVIRGLWSHRPHVPFAGPEGNPLIVFNVHPLHNIVHVAVGVLLAVGASRGLTASRAVNTLVGAVYFVLGLVGFALVGSDANILALNLADHLLHLATAALALFVGLTADRARTSYAGRTP